MAIRTAPESAGDDQVAVAQPAEGGGGAGEGDGGEQERDGEPGAVEEQQDGALADRVLHRGGGEDRAEGGADARRPGEGEGGAGDQRAAGAGARHQHVRPPLAVELRHERREHEQHAEGDDDRAGDLVERPAAVLQRRAERGGGHAQRHEDDGEGQAEDDRGHQDAAEALLALLDLGQRHARDGGQVAGHQRQHARRDEGDEADREGGDDRGVDAAGHRSKALSSASSRRASSGSSSGPAGALSVRRQRRATSAMPSAASATRAAGHQPGRDVEALARRLGQHVRAVLLHQRRLDLAPSSSPRRCGRG